MLYFEGHQVITPLQNRLLCPQRRSSILAGVIQDVIIILSCVGWASENALSLRLICSSQFRKAPWHATSQHFLLFLCALEKRELPSQFAF
jgi:hypothetical protein